MVFIEGMFGFGFMLLLLATGLYFYLLHRFYKHVKREDPVVKSLMKLTGGSVMEMFNRPDLIRFILNKTYSHSNNAKTTSLGNSVRFMLLLLLPIMFVFLFSLIGLSIVLEN